MNQIVTTKADVGASNYGQVNAHEKITASQVPQIEGMFNIASCLFDKITAHQDQDVAHNANDSHGPDTDNRNWYRN